MNKLEIKTNNHWNNLLFGYELPAKSRSDFDYIDAEEFDCHSFIKYRGCFYDVGEFMRVTDTMRNCHGYGTWQGYQADSYFSGVLIRLSDDGEQYQVGTWYA